VPFTFLPHEGGEGLPPPPPPPKTRIEPVPEKKEFEISWPNIIRIDHEYRQRLLLDLEDVEPLVLNASETATLAELAPVVEGKPDVTRVSEIQLQELGRQFRMQRIIFEAASGVFDQMRPDWKGNRQELLAQVVRLVERVLASDRITIAPPLFNQDAIRRRIVLTLNISRIVQHIWGAIRADNTLALVPVFDTQYPIRSTADMRTWFTSRPCEYTKRSHVNHCVFDSTWEASETFTLDRSPYVVAWAKNDHLGFEILYVFGGVVRKYRPDFLIRLVNGAMLVLEVKGQNTEEARVKREFLAEWVNAVNAHGGFGTWAWDVSRAPGEVAEILQRH
jgi:type III restriction enzyme